MKTQRIYDVIHKIWKKTQKNITIEIDRIITVTETEKLPNL